MSLLKQMIKEEWRMHSRLFGSTGLLLFPILILAFSLFTSYALQLMAVPQPMLLAGLQVLMLFLGLNVGTVGFVSRDAITNLLGEMTLLIFSSRTLPLSRVRILATFLVKDMLYYAVLFILPITLGILPVVESSSGLLFGPFVLFVATGSFMLGVSLSLLFASLYNRSKLLLLGFLLGLGGALIYFRAGILAFTPLSFLRRPTPGNLFFGFAPILVLAYLGVVLFRPRHGGGQRRRTDLYSTLRETLPGLDSLTAKFLLDIHRSSGGIWKLIFSSGVLFGFYIVLVTQIGFGNRFLNIPGFSFAVLLSLAAIPVYNWLNRFDNQGEYLKFPVDTEDIFRAKFYAFLVLGLPINYLFLLFGAAVYGTAGLTVGVFVMPLLSIYAVGIVAYIGGLEPNKSLLRTRNFLLFTVAMSIIIVPLFIASILYSSAPSFLGSFGITLAAAAGLTGYRALQHAPARWS